MTKHFLTFLFFCSAVVFAQSMLSSGVLNAQPVKLHSHNDYSRRMPFYQAYAQQCASIEADVFSTERADELLVAHDVRDLPSAFTLDELYIKPLLAVFDQNGGRAWRNSEQILALVIDMKTPADATLPRIIKKIAAYPEIFDPTVNRYAVRVVVSGKVPAAENFSTYPSFINFDGQLNDYTPQQLKRIFMISLNLRRYTGWNGRDNMPDADRQKLIKLVEQAHAMGKPIRFWGAPDNDNAWKILQELGVDYINTDRPEACAGFLTAAATSQTATNKHSKTTLYPSYKGLIMAGYQGWFPKPQDGVMYKDENRIHIDMWPDVSEYETTYPTGLKLKDGSTAKFFSSADKSTVDIHFKWMQQYGLDGVFMQRFFGDAQERSRGGYKNTVLRNALEAASKYKRAIAVMYDLSGLNRSGQDCSSLIEDWKYLVDSMRVTNQKETQTYLFFNGKPVVTIWGLGFPDRPYNIRNIGIERFIDFLKNDPVYGGCSVMLGVPTFWRDLNADCLNDPYLHTVIRSADLVMPWTVQRFSPLLHNDIDRYRDLIINDMEWCKINNVAYVPCVCPGFSWHNLSRHEFPDDIKPVASIPRQKGRFYWMQLATAINQGAGMVYVAMYDEVNEGTAIFKVTDNPPASNVAKFADMEGMPSDHYLWLTGEASKALKNNASLNLKMPTREDYFN